MASHSQNQQNVESLQDIETVFARLKWARTATEVARYSEQLCQVAIPYVRSIIQTRLEDFPADREDLVQDCLLRMHSFFSSASLQKISNIRSYIARIAQNLCFDFLRHKYPNRTLCADKVKNLIKNSPEVVSWQAHRGSYAGFVSWQERAIVPDTRKEERREALLADPFHVLSQLEDLQDIEDIRHPRVAKQVLIALLHHCEAPLPMHHLIEIYQELWDLKDRPFVAWEAEQEHATEAHTDGGLGEMMEQSETEQLKYSMGFLWNCIRAKLRPNHRSALLLQTREKISRRSLVSELILNEIATRPEITRVIENDRIRIDLPVAQLPVQEIAALIRIAQERLVQMRPEELEREIIRTTEQEPEIAGEPLPLSDKQIALLLDCRPQQVITLRAQARALLSRAHEKQYGKS